MNALKSKTILFSLLLAVLGAVEQNTAMVTSLVGPQNTGLAMLVIGAIVAALRAVTTKALSEK
jgi:hypothetical protein